MFIKTIFYFHFFIGCLKELTFCEVSWSKAKIVPTWHSLSKFSAMVLGLTWKANLKANLKGWLEGWLERLTWRPTWKANLKAWIERLTWRPTWNANLKAWLEGLLERLTWRPTWKADLKADLKGWLKGWLERLTWRPDLKDWTSLYWVKICFVSQIQKDRQIYRKDRT